MVVQAHHGAPLLKWSGLVLRQLVERLGAATAVDSAVLPAAALPTPQRTATTPSFRFLREAQPSQPRPALHGHPHTRNPIPIGARLSSIKYFRPVPGAPGYRPAFAARGHSSDRLPIILGGNLFVVPQLLVTEIALDASELQLR